MRLEGGLILPTFWPISAQLLVTFCPLSGLFLPTFNMKNDTETEEEQLTRVLSEMVKSGELLMEERDGELYFSLNKPTPSKDYVYEL